MSDISMGTIAKANGEGEAAMQLDLIQNVAVSISVGVGRSSLRIRGEVVLVNERYGIRLTQVVDPEDRVKHL